MRLILGYLPRIQRIWLGRTEKLSHTVKKALHCQKVIVIVRIRMIPFTKAIKLEIYVIRIGGSKGKDPPKQSRIIFLWFVDRRFSIPPAEVEKPRNGPNSSIRISVVDEMGQNAVFVVCLSNKERSTKVE